MNRPAMHILDLPVEMLLNIFKRLNNMDVLDSLIEVPELELLLQDQTFTNTLNFISENLENDFTASIDQSILNRFCKDILPRIQHNVKFLILETTNMDQILRAGLYPNLTQLKIFKFNTNVFSRLCTDELLFRSNFKKQITHLTLLNYYHDEVTTIDETTKIYVKIFDFFENLNSLNCNGSNVNENATLSFIKLPSTAFVSSNLTTLSITLNHFEDCLCLLDGRLSQLSTFTVIIVNVKDYSAMKFRSDKILNLKDFSLTYKSLTNQYDTQVVPLVRRMCNLQNLTLYVDIQQRDRLVDGIQLQNDILLHLSQLQTFVFYISTLTGINHPITSSSLDEIQRTFSHVKFGQVGCGINYVQEWNVQHHVFSLPYIFNDIGFIGNYFTNTIFKNITSLTIYDNISFKHEFFVRLARCFPLLKDLSIINRKPQSTDATTSEHNNTNQAIEVVAYPHLISLSLLSSTHIDYVEQMLNESKTRLPSLKELHVDYDQLKIMTNNFTRDGTRRNCINIEELDLYTLDNEDDDELINKQSKEFYDYFPSLEY